MVPKIHFVTLFPEVIHSYFAVGLFRRAIEKNILQIQTWNPRDFTKDKRQRVDDKPFGGGEGMVMLAEPVSKCLDEIEKENGQPHVVHLSPQGRVLTEEKAKELLRHGQLVFLSSRYSGMDQRLLNLYVDEEISIGDYVLAGGELPSLVVTEVLCRFLPGFLGDSESAEKDSFSLPGLESPLYTQPRVWKDQEVPDVLVSGNHLRIEDWKKKMAILVTLNKRSDLEGRFSENEILSARSWMDGLTKEELRVLGLEGLK